MSNELGEQEVKCFMMFAAQYRPHQSHVHTNKYTKTDLQTSISRHTFVDSYYFYMAQNNLLRIAILRITICFD